MAYDRKAPRPTNDSPIARRRLALGLTQAQLADIIGCYAKDICRWEKGVLSNEEGRDLWSGG